MSFRRSSWWRGEVFEMVGLSEESWPVVSISVGEVCSRPSTGDIVGAPFSANLALLWIVSNLSKKRKAVGRYSVSPLRYSRCFRVLSSFLS